MWFSKISDRMYGKEEIKNFDLQKFIKIFDHDAEDDPYIYGGGYDILEKHVKCIQPHIDHKIDLKKYDYQFGTYESDEKE